MRKRSKRKAPRQGKTNRVPKPFNGGKWSHAAFIGFFRSALRKASQRWDPLVSEVFKLARRPSQSTNKQLKWEYQCSECLGWYPRKEVNADHIIPCGKFTVLDDLPGYVARMFCEVEGIRVLCIKCHQRRTNGHMTSMRIKSDAEKLEMFSRVSDAMQRARGMPIAVRVDILAQSIEDSPQDLPVFLRWIWNHKMVPRIGRAELVADGYVPVRGRTEHLGFWLMMSRLRRRRMDAKGREESIREWKDCLCQFDQNTVKVAIRVLEQNPGWGLSLVHINSAMELAGQGQQALIEADDPTDFLEI